VCFEGLESTFNRPCFVKRSKQHFIVDGVISEYLYVVGCFIFRYPHSPLITVFDFLCNVPKVVVHITKIINYFNCSHYRCYENSYVFVFSS
jgi:hypothetical protein